MREISIAIKKRLPLIKADYVTIQIAKEKGILFWKEENESFKVSFDSNVGENLKVTVERNDLVNAFAQFKSRREPIEIEEKNDSVILKQKDNVVTIQKGQDISVSRVLVGERFVNLEDLSSFRDFLAIVQKKNANKALSIGNKILLSANGFYRITESEIYAYISQVATTKVFSLSKEQVKTLGEFLKVCPSEKMEVIYGKNSIMFKTQDFEYQTVLVEEDTLFPIYFSALTRSLMWKEINEADKDELYQRLKEKNGDYFTSILNKEDTVYAKDLGNLIYSLNGSVYLSENDKAVFLKNKDGSVLRIQTKKRV